MQIKERWWAEQLSYYPDPDPGLSIGLPRYCLRIVGTYERAIPAVGKLQNLYHIEQQQNNPEESRCGSNADDVSEARVLKPGSLQ